MNDKKVYTFIKLNRTKFIAKREDGLYDCRFGCFVVVVERVPIDPKVEQMKKVVKQYQGLEIETVYGPSIVVGLTMDQTGVELLEFGEEPYALSLEDFVDQIREYNNQHPYKPV